jgi:hypothetical protein
LFYVAGLPELTIGVLPPVRQEVAVKEEKTTPLRQRMIEDMRIRDLCAKTQQAHIRHVKHFAGFLGRSPDTATPDDLRAFQRLAVRHPSPAAGPSSDLNCKAANPTDTVLSPQVAHSGASDRGFRRHPIADSGVSDHP